MPDINITVAHKVAVSDTQSIVCDNSDYTVRWTLDDEWSAYDTKTMRTIYMDGTFMDTVFSGNVIALPVCTVPGVVQIGLYAGNLRTSRVAILRALPSVRSAAGAPEDPEPNVYDQLMDLIKGLGGAGMGITGAKIGQIAKITAVDASGVPTAWSPVDMPSGEEKWEKIAEIELRTDTAEYVLADFATWRKAKVIMRRSAYVSGLNKNVWVVVKRPNVGEYSCGYLAGAYGYVYWEFTAEVNELLITSTALENNNLNAANTIRSTCTLTPLDASPSDCVFGLRFTDTSVIQAGDKVTVIGVRR